jgi:hypothetical protein
MSKVIASFEPMHCAPEGELLEQTSRVGASGADERLAVEPVLERYPAMDSERTRGCALQQRLTIVGTTKEIAGTHQPLSQLLGRRRRLERELSHAFSVRPLQGALIKRLVEELTATESAISDMKVVNT